MSSLLLSPEQLICENKGYKEGILKGPMLRFEDSLPRLPMPTLEETAARYIKSVHPLLSPPEFESTKTAVAEFIKPGGAGSKLQEKLIAHREDPKHKNWIYEWWTDAAYPSYRDPVVPYVSYFYSYRDDKSRRNPIKRAAAITTAALEFKKMVDQSTLEPEYMKKLPMDVQLQPRPCEAIRPLGKILSSGLQAHLGYPQESILQSHARN
jgi:carnitine O-acetyltransferase